MAKFTFTTSSPRSEGRYAFAHAAPITTHPSVSLRAASLARRCNPMIDTCQRQLRSLVTGGGFAMPVAAEPAKIHPQAPERQIGLAA